MRIWSLTALVVLASSLALGCAGTGDTPKSEADGQGSGETSTADSPPAGAGGDAGDMSLLMNPKAAVFKDKAPSTYRAKFETSKGNFVVEVDRALAPRGADRFYHLVNQGYYDGCRFFRVVEGFMVQFGMNGDPKITQAWQGAKILDDVPKETNGRGMITFATSGPHSRTTQVFINFKDNSFLDRQGFAPFGRVVEGMDEVVDKLHNGYGDGLPQHIISARGNEFLDSEYPDLDFVIKASIIEG